MLLTKEQLLVHHVASKDESRPVLCTVYFTQDGNKTTAVATDSYMLAEITSEVPDDSDFPETGGEKVTPSIEGYVTKDNVKKALASLPRKGALPILDYAQLTTESLDTTDLSSVSRFSAQKDSSPFPNYQSIIPSGEPAHSVKLNPKLLKQLLEVFKDDTEVTLEFHNAPDGNKAQQPLILRASNMETKKLGLIMPLRS
jgi:hypothetical protein